MEKKRDFIDYIMHVRIKWNRMEGWLEGRMKKNNKEIQRQSSSAITDCKEGSLCKDDETMNLYWYL